MTDVSTELTWYIGDNSLFCATLIKLKELVYMLNMMSTRISLSYFCVFLLFERSTSYAIVRNVI